MSREPAWRWLGLALCAASATCAPAAPEPTYLPPSAGGHAGPQSHGGKPWAYSGHQADMRRVPVKMYMAPWCPVCQRARAWLLDQGYRFVEHDVEQDRQAARVLATLNPRGSIPTFHVDGRVLRGFDPRLLENLVSEAATARRQ